MSGQTSKIKRQLKSVVSTKKLTNAMSLVATAKLQKERTTMAKNKLFSETFHRFLLAALSAKKEGEVETNPYLVAPACNNPLHIIITSNSGLCGSYNQDLLKYVERNIPKTEAIFVIGTYGIKWLHAQNYMVVKEFADLEDFNPRVINRLISDALTLYRNGEISSIDVIYTQYVNSLKFVPSIYSLLPIHTTTQVEESEFLLEPSRDAILNSLIPMYVSSMIYSTFLQAKTSEQASRRSAMETANHNADELIQELQLSYNRARQASITQEMTEIIAGSSN